jgi:hypothetical protein
MKVICNGIISVLFTFFYYTGAFSQGIAIGEWRDHLPYNDCISITEGDGIVYCATTKSVFSFNKSDNSIERLTKVNYLSDIGVSRISYHKGLKILLVAYTNGNIDLLENNTVTNISDIKRKLIPGNKSINNILFIGNNAYLSCGFGIVVLDLAKKEIKDTYYIGPNGGHIEVFDITFDGTKLYAATESGVYEANINDPSLSNYQSWTKHIEMPHPDSKFNSITCLYNTLYVNLSSVVYNSDTLYKYSNGVWSYFNPAYSSSKHNLHVYNNKLFIVNEGDVEVFDTTGTSLEKIWTYNNPDIPDAPAPRDINVDQDNTYWIADKNLGIVKNWSTWNSLAFRPNGPLSSNVFAMSVEESNLWVAPGGHDDTWNNLYNREGVFSFIDEKWQSYNSTNISGLDTIYDILFICVNPSNPSNVLASSWSRGLLEFNNQSLSGIWDESNSTLIGNGATGNSYRLRVGGICFDDEGNMWVTNSGVNTALNVRIADGTWKAFDFSGYINNNEVGNVVIDKNNQKWIILPRNNGLLVFDDNNTISNTSDDKKKLLSNAVGNGNLPSNDIYSIAIDLDGEIWVGTDKGIAVFYTPENVFSGSNFDAQQILVNQDGFIQPLLQSEIVTAIAIDGANRKWIGTQRAGVFLVSADGTQQLEHFTEDNSPLFSNTINCIAINHKTGEIFFGTDKGIISYKGTATIGGTEYTDVLVYPNPVSENYTGYIAIRGLVADADVKITDITGTLIYQTVAEGGQAVWNGKNYSGEKAKTGVYLVFCSNADGSKTLVTKILIIN